MTSPSGAVRRRLGVTGAALIGLIAPVLVAGPAYASSTRNEIVYVSGDANFNYDVVIRDLESRTATTVLTSTAQNGHVYDDPSLSPDGGRIAVATNRGNLNPEAGDGIAVVDRTGQNFRRLTQPPASASSISYDLFPAWRPGSSGTILFSRLTYALASGSGETARYTVTSQLFTIASSGGAGSEVAVPGGAGGLTGDWSPDGANIVFADLSGDSDPDGLGVGPITRVPFGPASPTRVRLGNNVVGVAPSWSPDGTTIAYSHLTDPDTDPLRGAHAGVISTVPAAGGSATQLTVTRPNGAVRSLAEYPSWTPDSESIVFDLFSYDSSGTPLPSDLWAVDRRGTRAGPITRTPRDDIQANVHGPAPSSVSSGQQSTYVPVTPRRVLDTRPQTNVGAPARKVGPGETITLPIRGLATAQGAVPADASAVVLNVTVTDPTANTDVRVYPTPAGTVPTVSNINASAGQTVPNLVTATIGADGAVAIRNSGGTVNLIADIAGYYRPGTAGVGFEAVEPRRILETRAANNVGAPARKVGPAQFLDLTVRGTLPVSGGGTVTVPQDATAVVLNVTATGPTAATDIRVYPKPADGSLPTVSNLNLRAGQTAPNLVTVAVGQDDQVRLRNAGGSVDLIADIAGYYGPSAPGRFVPVVPTRFLDTRSGVGAAPILTTANGTVDLRIAGARGVPAGAFAAVMNLTGTTVSQATDVRAFPFGATLPTVSNLNLAQGTTRANLAIVMTGQEGRVRLRNNAGSTNLIGDLAGYMVRP